jgi:hypothetical protein
MNEFQNGGMTAGGTAGKQDAQNGCWLGFPAGESNVFRQSLNSF